MGAQGDSSEERGGGRGGQLTASARTDGTGNNSAGRGAGLFVSAFRGARWVAWAVNRTSARRPLPPCGLEVFASAARSSALTPADSASPRRSSPRAFQGVKHSKGAGRGACALRNCVRPLRSGSDGAGAEWRRAGWVRVRAGLRGCAGEKGVALCPLELSRQNGGGVPWGFDCKERGPRVRGVARGLRERPSCLWEQGVALRVRGYQFVWLLCVGEGAAACSALRDVLGAAGGAPPGG